MKKTYSFIPLWFLLIMPPLLILLLTFNLAMSAIGMITTAIFLKVENPFDDYYKNTLKIFFISLIPTVFISIMYFLPQLLRKFNWIYDNFIYHLEYNPYKGILSFVYIVLVFIVSIYITFEFVDRFIMKKRNLEEEKKFQATTILTLLIIPYILFIPSTMLLKPNKSNLDDFYGTIMRDDKTIVKLLENLSISKHMNSYFLETKKEPYTMHIYVNDIVEYRKSFEMDSSIIFYLVKDVNEVRFHMNDDIYSYKINDINSIFGDVSKKTLNDINDRYKTSFMNSAHYLGRVGEYDIYDSNTKVGGEPKLLYSQDEINYYLECNDINKIIAVKDNLDYSLAKLLKNKKITAKDLVESQLEIMIAGGVEDENTDK